MTSIAEMAEEIHKLIGEDEEREAALWQWFSQQHYQQVVRQSGEDHPLVRIKQRFDITVIEQACAGYRLYAGQRGVEATHSVRQLCWGVLVKAVMGWSFEQTANEVRTNSLLRWFVGYNLHETTFSEVTLWRFEEWQKEHYPRLVFNELLKQIDKDFEEDVQATQIGDTFALQARAREQSHTELVRNSSRKLLQALEQVTAAGYQQLLVEIELEELFGKPDEPREWWLKKEQRIALEERTALAAMQMLAVVNKTVAGLPPSRDVNYLALQRWLEVVKKVLKDEFTFEQEQDGRWSKATVRIKHEKSAYVIGSTVDLEATFRDHGDKSELAYNVSVAATTNFIREIAAATGATPDSKGVAPLIEVQKEQLGTVPPKFVYDRAAGTAKTYAEVAKASDGQTQLVARLVDHSKSSKRFGPNDFTIREDGGLECPNGVTSHKFYRSGSGAGWNYRFHAKQCQGCPLLEQCRGDEVKDGAMRQVYISNYIVEQRKAILYLDTDAATQDLKLRANIERIIACLVRYNGARRAKGDGLRNADYQARMAAVAYNPSALLRTSSQTLGSLDQRKGEAEASHRAGQHLNCCGRLCSTEQANVQGSPHSPDVSCLCCGQSHPTYTHLHSIFVVFHPSTVVSSSFRRSFLKKTGRQPATLTPAPIYEMLSRRAFSRSSLGLPVPLVCGDGSFNTPKEGVAEFRKVAHPRI